MNESCYITQFFLSGIRKAREFCKMMSAATKFKGRHTPGDMLPGNEAGSSYLAKMLVYLAGLKFVCHEAATN